MELVGRFIGSFPDLDDGFDNFFLTQVGIMESPQIQMRARDYLKVTYPEFMAESARTLNYKVINRPDTWVFDLIVESDNPQYAQVYLQACMDEYLKFKKESLTSSTTMTAVTADLSKFEAGIRNKEDEIENFLSSNNNGLDKSRQAQLSRITSELARLKERYKQMLANLSSIQYSQTLTEHQGLVSISQAATIAKKLEPRFFDSLF